MNILNNSNLNSHKGRPYTPPGMQLTLWQTSDNFLQCSIESQGCKFSKESGACVMCDYGIGRNLTAIELKYALENTVREKMLGIDTILFGSYGSVLDEYEISNECLDVILNFVLKSNVKNVIFETHYSTVTHEKLCKIRNAIGSKCIITIEMGYESCDEYVLSNCLRKVMNLDYLKETINLIHNVGMEASLNVFVGAPFISQQEQTLTAVESVEWAFLNGADDVVIFPANIKPFTLLYDLYKAGYYSELSHWQLIDVLNRIPEKYLNRVYISWYGDRKNIYENDQYPLLPPKDCEKCHEKIFAFYRNFSCTKNGKSRKELLSELLGCSAECSCRSEYLHNFNSGVKRLSPGQIQEIVENIKKT